MISSAKKLIPAFTRFVLLHLVLTLFSLPFLIAWGLPVSLLSPLGNFICSPIITLFLFFSSLFFFTELLYIPNGIIVWCLEQITALWLYVLSLNHYSWLIGFSKPPLIILFLIFFCAFGITYHQGIGTRYRSIAALSFLLGVSWICLTFFYPSQKIHAIACNRGKHLCLVYKNNQTIIIDPGYLQSQSASWIRYTLPSEIVTRTGAASLDHLIILQLSPRIFQAVQTLALQITIKNLYLPCGEGLTDTIAYKQLDEFLKNRGTHLICINHPLHIPLNNTSTITLQSPCKPHHYQTAHAIITIDSIKTTIYAAKQKKKDKDFHE